MWKKDDDGCPYIPRAFCDRYALHEPHAYRAINGNTYSCPGFDAEDQEYMIQEETRPPCEHGLSQSLCVGPSHYPLDM